MRVSVRRKLAVFCIASLLAILVAYKYAQRSTKSDKTIHSGGYRGLKRREMLRLPTNISSSKNVNDEPVAVIGGGGGVTEWNRSEPIVIFINQFSAMDYIYDNSATRWEKESPSCPTVRCRMTHNEIERETADGLLLNRFVPLRFREQLKRYHDKQVVFVLNMEGEKEPEWRDPEITSKFDFKIGYSIKSDLPMLYGCGDFDGIDIIDSLITRFEANQIKPPVNRHGLVAMISNCMTVPNDRLTVLRAMMKSLNVSSFGKCENNMNVTQTRFLNPNWHQMKLDVFKNFKFGMAYESNNLEEYVTEKIYSCLHTGVIPIYHGAPDIKTFVPGGSFINAADFKNTEELIQHIVSVDANPQLYASYFKWDISAMKRLHELYCSVPVYCRWCEMVGRLRHEKRQRR